MAGTPISTSGPEKRGRRMWSRLLWITLAAIVVIMALEIALLIRQNQKLRATINELGGAARQPLAAELEIGEVVPALELISLDGAARRIGFDGPSDTWLLVFSPSCPACNANMENWEALTERLDPSSSRVFYVSAAPAGQTPPLRRATGDLAERCPGRPRITGAAGFDADPHDGPGRPRRCREGRLDRGPAGWG